MVKSFGKNGYVINGEACSADDFYFTGVLVVEKLATIETSQNASIEISAHR